LGNNFGPGGAAGGSGGGGGGGSAQPGFIGEFVSYKQ